MADFGKLNFSVAFNPTSAFPIDARTIFDSYDDALEAAKSAKEAGSTDSVYYYGMVLTVVDPTTKTAKHYTIEASGEEGKLTETIKTTDVVDNLTTADSTKPLSAKQGKEIADYVKQVVDEAGEAINLAYENATKYTDEKLANINIDDTNLAKLDATNTFSLVQSFGGKMPNANTASENTTLIGKSTYVMGAKDASGGWVNYSILNAGSITLLGATSNQITINARGSYPSISATDAKNGMRSFSFPAKSGTLALAGSGFKVYDHRIVMGVDDIMGDPKTYHLFSISDVPLSLYNGDGTQANLGKIIGFSLDTNFKTVYGLGVNGAFLGFLEFDFMNPVGATVKDFDFSNNTINSYKIIDMATNEEIFVWDGVYE